VLHYDGGNIVLIAPSLHHLVTLSIAQDVCRQLISEYYDKFCGLQNNDNYSREHIDLLGLGTYSSQNSNESSLE
jgi:hypothetical protein